MTSVGILNTVISMAEGLTDLDSPYMNHHPIGLFMIAMVTNLIIA